MKHIEIIQQLKAPFAFDEVEAKIQVTNGDRTKGKAVFYLDARAVHERLDTILGAFNWRNEYIKWNEKSQICGLSIYNAEDGEWITKYDGAENSDIEPIKGGLTDAFKRSAVLWGVGRYLYQIEGVWVEIEQRGKGFYIKDNQMGRLKAEYDKAVAKIFGSTHLSTANVIPSSNPVGSQVMTPNSSANTSAISKLPRQTAVENNTMTVDADISSSYWVHSVKPSGKESQLLELVNLDGTVVSAYIKNGDKAIKTGSMLKDVSMVQKQSSYGQYNLINGYKIAA